MSEHTHKNTEEGWWETVRVIIHALIIALVVRTFLFQPFNIPSGSMIPTLLIGDYLFVSKYSYGYSKHSFPFSPDVFKGRVWASQPKRGDVAVFKLPRDNETDYIKRIVGVPGDKIQMFDGVLHVNGKAVIRKKIADFRTVDDYGNLRRAPRYSETLPGGVTHTTLDLDPRSYTDNTPEFSVPEGHYFMMGDNRDNSSDSRVPGGGVGFVPFENLVGKAQVIFFSMKKDARIWQIWRWPDALRLGRMFKSIK